MAGAERAARREQERSERTGAGSNGDLLEFSRYGFLILPIQLLLVRGPLCVCVCVCVHACVRACVNSFHSTLEVVACSHLKAKGSKQLSTTQNHLSFCIFCLR